MADLEANLMHLQLMHESLTRFSESFASFLYGLNMNAFCVDFPEVQLSTILLSLSCCVNQDAGSDLRVVPQSKTIGDSER